MRRFTKKEIEEYLNYIDREVISLQEVLDKCFICGVPLDKVELPEGPEKQVVCLKDRDIFVESFEIYENPENELEFEPELIKKVNSGLIPGEIILLDWCSGKNTEKRFPKYFKGYGVDVPTSINKLLDKRFLEFGNYYEQLNALKVPELRELLKDHKIKSKGRKKELVQRLLDNDISLSNIPKVFKLTDEGKKILEYNEHVLLAHKDKFFPVYMAVRYREKFPYPTSFEELKLGVLDIKIDEYTTNNRLFELFQCFKIKSHHLEVYNQDYEKALVYAILLVLIDLYEVTRIIRFGVKRIDYDVIDRLITVSNMDKRQFDYSFNQALNLINFNGYNLDLIELSEINYIKEAIYNNDYIKTQKYIEKYINAEFYIKHDSIRSYMFISNIKNNDTL